MFSEEREAIEAAASHLFRDRAVAADVEVDFGEQVASDDLCLVARWHLVELTKHVFLLSHRHQQSVPGGDQALDAVLRGIELRSGEDLLAARLRDMCNCPEALAFRWA